LLNGLWRWKTFNIKPNDNINNDHNTWSPLYDNKCKTFIKVRVNKKSTFVDWKNDVESKWEVERNPGIWFRLQVSLTSSRETFKAKQISSIDGGYKNYFYVSTCHLKWLSIFCKLTFAVTYVDRKFYCFLFASFLVCLSVNISVCLFFWLPTFMLVYISVACLHFCQSLSLSFYIFVRLHFCLSLSLSVYISVCLYFCLFIFLSVYISVCLLLCLSTFLSIYISVCLYLFLSIFLSVYISVCLYLCLSIYLSVYISVCLFFCLSFFLSEKYFCLTIFLSDNIFVTLYFCLYIFLSVYISVGLFSVCLYFFLSTQKEHEWGPVR
jgi:hypothetical protein